MYTPTDPTTVARLVKQALFSASPIRRAEAGAALRLAGLPISPRAITISAELAAEQEPHINSQEV